MCPEIDFIIYLEELRLVLFILDSLLYALCLFFRLIHYPERERLLIVASFPFSLQIVELVKLSHFRKLHIFNSFKTSYLFLI